MRQRLSHDRRAALVDAAQRDLLLELQERLAADRTSLRRLDLLRAPRAFGDEDVDDFRDDVAAFLDGDRVSDAHVLARQLIEVVQRSVDDFRSAEAHRIELRDGGDRACPPDVVVHFPYDRLRRFGRVLEGYDPARRLRGRAELELFLAAIHLHDDAVDLEQQVVAMLAPMRDEGFDFGQRRTECALRIRRKSELIEQLVGRGLRLHAAIRGDQVIQVRAELLLRDELRILLPQRTCRGVARIRQRLESRFFERFVVLREVGLGDVDLASDFETLHARIDLQRQRAHGADVRRHVVAACAVAARGAAHERAVLVEERDRDAVDLQLRFVFDDIIGRFLAEAAADALIPGAQLVERVCILDREHRRIVNHRREAFDRRAADALRRRIRIVELRMLRFQIGEAAQHLVEFVVADLGLRLEVVEAVVALELGAQFLDFLLRLHAGT